MREILVFLVEWAGVIAVTMLLALSPAFQKRRPLVFVYPRREGLVALGIFVLVAAVLYAIAVLVPTPFDPVVPGNILSTTSTASHPGYLATQLSRQILAALILLVPCALALLIRRQPFLSAGLPRPTMRAGIQLGLALALITIFLTNKTFAILRGLSSDQLLYLGGMLVTGLAVEFVFRGFIQLRLAAWLGQTWGWIAASGLYALSQIPQKLLVEHSSLGELGASLALVFAFGLVLGWIMKKTGNVLGPGLYHAVHNWLMVVG